MKKICLRCQKEIDTKKELFVLLGTYHGKIVKDESYFHIFCWREHFEEKARDKALAVVSGMQKKMLPMAKQLIGRFQGAIDDGSDDGTTQVIIK